MIQDKNARRKRCRNCGELFSPRSSLQIACKMSCAIAVSKTKVGKEHRDKSERKALREAKKGIKSRSQWMKEAQAAFNKYIRLRDKDLPCISCQRFHSGQYHAGHYRSVGAHPELRFNEHNNNKQCAPCNNHLSGNLVDYRINLIKKIGLPAVEWLEGPHKPCKYTVDDLKEIREKYRSLAKELSSDC